MLIYHVSEAPNLEIHKSTIWLPTLINREIKMYVDVHYVFDFLYSLCQNLDYVFGIDAALFLNKLR